MSELRKAIDKQNAIVENRFAAQDMETLKNSYTEDVRIMPPGTKMKIGRQAIPEVFGPLFAAGVTSIHLGTEEVGPLGSTYDVAYERGLHKFSKADGSEFASGKYIVIWKRTSNGYKVYSLIFNSDS